MPELGETRIEGSVVLKRIAISIKQRRIEITEGAVAWLPIVRQSNVAAPEVNASVVAREEDKGLFPAVAVMGFAAVGKVKEHRVVEHRAVALGHALEALDDAIDDLHVVRARQLANGLR